MEAQRNSVIFPRFPSRYCLMNIFQYCWHQPSVSSLIFATCQVKEWQSSLSLSHIDWVRIYWRYLLFLSVFKIQEIKNNLIQLKECFPLLREINIFSLFQFSRKFYSRVQPWASLWLSWYLMEVKWQVGPT